jgi:Ca-activated chloride channel family protein
VSFQTPLALLGLLALPLLLAGYLYRERHRQSVAARYANPALLPGLVDDDPGRRRHLPVAILMVALAAMIVGVARPHATISVKREEATVILAIDTSRSMKATDVQPTRLVAAKGAASAFLTRIPDKYRVGVVGFASRATVAVPPTVERPLVESALASLKPGEGTALGDAIVLSARIGQRQRGEDGSVPPTSVLLISDGTRDGGTFSVQTAIRRARQQKVPVYTVLVGTPAGVVEETLTGGYRRIIQVPPAPDALRRIASGTGGEFFTATSDERLDQVYEELGSRLGSKKQSREITDAFAGGAVVLLLAGGALSALWFRRVP